MRKVSKSIKLFGTRNCVVIVLIVLTAVAVVMTAVGIYDHCRSDRRMSVGDNYTAQSKPSGSDPMSLATAKDAAAVKALGKLKVPDYVNVDYIKPSRARTTEKLTGIHNIVIHYTGNPGTTAKQNRSYFGQPDTLVCSHFLVGLRGEIIQCLPLDEQSAASNHRNVDTISIEVCHPDSSGKFTDDSYASAVKLAAWLCRSTGLTADDLIRHHDVTGKNCPKYFVDHTDEWEQFKADVKDLLK